MTMMSIVMLDAENALMLAACNNNVVRFVSPSVLSKVSVFGEQTKLKKQTEYEKTGITGTTNEFKCDKCHARSTTYYYMQLRSADEPMTCCITCTKCHHQWKQ